MLVIVYVYAYDRAGQELSELFISPKERGKCIHYIVSQVYISKIVSNISNISRFQNLTIFEKQVKLMR